MAKGFTVKASSPKVKEKKEEWNYDEIKKRWRGKKFV